MRKNIDIKIINKSNIFDNSFINEKKNRKNSILKKKIKNILKKAMIERHIQGKTQIN